MSITKIDGSRQLRFSSDLNLQNHKILNVSTPTNDSDAANKAYVDSVASGVDAKQSAVAATVGALPSLNYANGTAGVGATLTGSSNGALPAQDGVTLVQNERLLVKTQASAFQNGIYTLTQVGDGSSPFILTRTTDNDSSSEVVAAFVFIEEGTTNADSGWVCTTNAPVTMGTTDIDWSQFSGAGTIIAGDGLDKTGNTLAVNVDSSTIEINADTLRVKASGITANHLATSVAGDGLTGGGGSALAVNFDNSTLETSSDVLRVKASGITSSHLATSVAGDGLAGGGGSALSVNVDDTTIEINADSLRIKAGGISASHLASDSITGIKLDQRKEIVSGVLASDQWTLSATPYDDDHLLLFRNGIMQTSGIGNDYTRSGAVITFVDPTDSADMFVAVYLV